LQNRERVPSIAMLEYVEALIRPLLSKRRSLDQPVILRGHNNVDYIRAAILLYTAYGIPVEYQKNGLRSDVLAGYQPNKNSPEVVHVEKLIQEGKFKPIVMPEQPNLMQDKLDALQQAKKEVIDLQPVAEKLSVLPLSQTLVQSIKHAEKLINKTREDKLTPELLESSGQFFKKYKP